MRNKEFQSKITPEIIQVIKDKELELENVINKYRIFLTTLLLLSINTLIYFFGSPDFSRILIGIPAIVLAYTGMWFLHRITKKKKTIPLLKYITVSIDYIIVLLFTTSPEAMFLMTKTVGVSIQQYIILISLLFILINGFSAIRLHIGVIFFSAFLGLCLNGYVHYTWGDSALISIATSVFIIASSFFNSFISGFIIQSYMLNHQLSIMMKEVETANQVIIVKNNEINEKNSELNTQNEYLYTQNTEIAIQKKQILSSIQYASRIQDAVLNTTNTIQEVAPNSFIVYKPRDIVSGDFYWFKKVEVFTNEYKVFAAVDCTGHGVPGAFMSMLGTSFLNDIVTEFYTELNAADILDRMREKVKNHLQQGELVKTINDGMDMALCAIDYNQMELQYAGANTPLFIIRLYENGYASEVEELQPDRMPIGVYVKEKPFTNNRVSINKGDLLYVFSDGYVDQFGGHLGEKFKKKRLKELLLRIAHMPMTEQKEILEEQFNNWKGDNYKQIDDVTVIGVKV